MNTEYRKHVILAGVVGSTAYGLNHEGSDIDRMGIFAWPTEAYFRLEAPADYWEEKTPARDTTFHEVRKYLGLVLNGNPTASELLWLERWDETSYLGEELVEMRQTFLSGPRVKDAYLGYARQQYHRLQETGAFSSALRKRTEKHARHLRRLVEQGYQLYTTGELTIRVSDPEAVMEFGREVAKDPEYARAYMDGAVARFEDAKTVLPPKPNPAVAEEWLMDLRKDLSAWT
jgi:predicted nucleotidyltransferase